jgi:hypothetical protein
LEDQGSVNDCLDICIAKDKDKKTISMVQSSLIDNILNNLNVASTSKTKDTPVLGIYSPDKNGQNRQESWNYHYLIGKLNFLAQPTHPDITYAVHQCTRYSNRPTALHELAVKCIGCYLLATRNKGLTLQLQKTFKLDMYVNTDLACGCFIHWASK